MKKVIIAAALTIAVSNSFAGPRPINSKPSTARSATSGSLIDYINYAIDKVASWFD